MATPYLSPVYSKFLDFIVEKASPEEILAFQLSEEDKARAIDLMERHNAGELELNELVELEQMRQMDRILTLLKARARQFEPRS